MPLFWFRKRKEEKHLEISKAVKEIIDFLKNSNNETQKIRLLLEEFDQLEKERKILTDHRLKKMNLVNQINLFDKILINYQLWETDASINGQRIKKIAKELIGLAKKEKLAEYEKIRKDLKWTFDW